MSFDFFTMTSPLSPTSPRHEQPKFRHSNPSGPWPFLDSSDEVDPHQLNAPPRLPDDDDHEYHWSEYPKSLFPNWTYLQQKKSGIAKITARKGTANPSVVYGLNVLEDGTFYAGDKWTVNNNRDGTEETFWHSLQDTPSSDVRVRAFFVDNLNGPTLQMLGSRFNIEPFFFSSSLSGIPSRYQSSSQIGIGDHVTITLSFIRKQPHQTTTSTSSFHTPAVTSFGEHKARTLHVIDQVIDTHGPLRLHSTSSVIGPDLLSLHVIRRVLPAYAVPTSPQPSSPGLPTFDSPDTHLGALPVSNIISYHAPQSPGFVGTTAARLHERLLSAGHSVYWSKIFANTVPSGDPTFVLLSLLWYPMYAWDEALETLVGEVSWLENHTLSTLPKSTDDNEHAHDNTQRLTHQLHVVRAHLLHYEGLLEDFRKSIVFLLDHPHPGLPKPKISESPLRRGNLGSPPTSAKRRSSRPVPVISSPISFRPSTLSSTFFRAMSTTSEVPLDGLPGDDSDDEGSDALLRKDPRLQDLFDHSEALLKRETLQLFNEIDRLQMTRKMLDRRLGNVMALAFSSVNIEDSKRMSKMTEAALKDSAAMRLIAILTMFFLPATFMASVFGMNVEEINPGTSENLRNYFAAAIPLTAVTCAVMMFQSHRMKAKAKAQLRHYGIQSQTERLSPNKSNTFRWPTEWWQLARQGHSRHTKPRTTEDDVGMHDSS